MQSKILIAITLTWASKPFKIPSITISKYKLINLLTAVKRNQKVKIKNPVISIIVIALIFGAYYILFVHKDIYYTQIDNTKIEQISSTIEQ